MTKDAGSSSKLAFYEILGRQNMNLLWQLKEVLDQLPVREILDVGGGSYVSRNICMPGSIDGFTVVDPGGEMIELIISTYRDARLKPLKRSIETAGIETLSFDLALFVLSLIWIDDPLDALNRVLSCEPAFIAISNLEFTTRQRDSLCTWFPEHSGQLIARLKDHETRSIDIEALMASKGYFPLSIYSSGSWGPTPDHHLRTALYTREEPDRTPYENVRFIVQVNSVCNCNCPVCYVDKTGEHMIPDVFKELIENLKENETICLRGGEPTLTENLISDFIVPSLEKGLHVILESNGAFINSSQYRKYLAVLTDPHMSIRLSLDRQHIDSFPAPVRPLKIKWLARFIEDALRLNIKFGLFSLGMSRAQVSQFLAEYGVTSWLPFVKPLTKYSDITELSISGKFVDVAGDIHDHITGVGWVGSPDMGNFEAFLRSLDNEG